jgi:hypothetical protein
VLHGRRSAGLPDPGEVAALGFTLVGLNPDGREAEQRAYAETEVKVQVLERLVAETRAELASMQPRRKRALHLPE